ncbi:MAG: signal recognition particle protein [Aerococcus sp.]|nr:signal recognition particle protein [Aerococcus sp.]
MAFESLSDRLQGSVEKLGKKGGKISEADLREMMREVRLALLEADVNFKVVRQFVHNVQDKALNSDVLGSLTPAQQIVKIVDQELTALLGGEQVGIQYAKTGPTIVMMAGLQGAGKTTTVGKLANYLRSEQHRKPFLIAGDVYRPAAIDQLETIGRELDLPVYQEGVDANPVEIAKRGIQKATEEGCDLIFIDTAGRLQIDERLMQELEDIKAAVHPDEILLTVDAMTGQEAANVAKTFDERLNITGVIVTKLDGDTRGGAALSIASITHKPIKFSGTGEKLEDIETFYPDRMSNRILGMGDMMTLIEKAEKEFDAAEAEAMAEKMRANTYDFNDFIKQMDQLNHMGPLEGILKMIPGVNKMLNLDQIKLDPKDMARTKAMIQSMTKYEREHPDDINQSRRRRIAKGSSTTVTEVNRLIKQFNQSRTMMSAMSNGDTSALQNMMGMGGGFGQQTPAGKGMNKVEQVQAQRKMRKMKKLGKRRGKKK